MAAVDVAVAVNMPLQAAAHASEGHISLAVSVTLFPLYAKKRQNQIKAILIN